MNSFMNCNYRPVGIGAVNVGRHSVIQAVRAGRRLRQSGSSLLVAALLLAPAQAQEVRMQLDLRSGESVSATGLSGSLEAGFVAQVARGSQRIAAQDLLAVRIGGAVAPQLLKVEIVGGDLIHGAIAGGDKAGERLEFLSPVLGQIAVSIDRMVALEQPGVDARDQPMPEGVDEALYLRTRSGFDLIAGFLHAFGSKGILFQPDAADGPQWYSPTQFSSLRLRGGEDREKIAPMTLLTRTADRLGVTLLTCGEQGLDVVVDSGATVHIDWADVACLTFERGVTHLSAMTPAQVVETGFEGEVVYSWQKDRSVIGGELMAQGLAFGRGIGMHSKSRLSFLVPEGATHFYTRVAFDDSVAELPVKAHAEVRVLVGNKVLFEDKELQQSQTTQNAGLHAVKVGDTITLEADFGRGRDLGDRVNWLLPMFLMRS